MCLIVFASFFNSGGSEQLLRVPAGDGPRRRRVGYIYILSVELNLYLFLFFPQSAGACGRSGELGAVSTQ